MATLYWISVLSSIEVWLFVFMIIGFLLSCVSLGIAFFAKCDNEPEVSKRTWAFSKVFLTMFAIGSLNIFIPNKTEMYAIYGVGTVIDYLQDSDEAKKLPDNVLKAANYYLEQYQENKLQELESEVKTLKYQNKK